MARLANQMKQLYAMCATALVMGRADLDGADDVGFDIELPIFTVGQAAELGNIHPRPSASTTGWVWSVRSAPMAAHAATACATSPA